MFLGSRYFNPSVLSGFALVQASGCTGSEVSVGLHQWLMWKEVTMNVVALYVTLEKTLFKQAVRSLRYLKTYLSSTQPPAISSGVYTSSRRNFFMRWALGERTQLCKANTNSFIHASTVWSHQYFCFWCSCSVLAHRWFGHESVKLEWICAIWWLEQLWAQFSVSQERL